MRVLLIVDIQRTMGEWFPWSYIAKIDKFLHKEAKNYDKVLMLTEVDNVKRSVFPDAVLNLGDWSIKSDEVPEFLVRHLTHTPFYKFYMDDFWKVAVSRGLADPKNWVRLSLYGGRSHYNMFLNEGLRQLMGLLGNATHVDLIGGGVDKCVMLTKVLLDQYNISNSILKEYCYDIRCVNTNRRSENTFDTMPINGINKRILTIEGKLSLVNLPFTFNP